MSRDNADLYSKYPELYDIIYGWDGYDTDSEFIQAFIDEQLPGATTLLDVACGTGLHLVGLKERMTIEGVDFEDGILEVAREKHPDLSFQQAYMRDFDLGKTFDVVICFGLSIGYMTTPEEMAAAISNMGAHVRPGGLMLMEPWLWPERFWVDRYTGGYIEHDKGNIAWMQHADREGDLSVFDIHYVFQSPDGIVHFQDHETMGLFTDEQYREAFDAAGMDVTYDADAFKGYGMYAGRKRS